MKKYFPKNHCQNKARKKTRKIAVQFESNVGLGFLWPSGEGGREVKKREKKKKKNFTMGNGTQEESGG